MFIFLCENIISKRTVRDMPNNQSGFFKYLSGRTLFDGFIEFQMTAGKCPGTCTMRIQTFA